MQLICPECGETIDATMPRCHNCNCAWLPNLAEEIVASWVEAKSIAGRKLREPSLDELRFLRQMLFLQNAEIGRLLLKGVDSIDDPAAMQKSDREAYQVWLEVKQLLVNYRKRDRQDETEEQDDSEVF